MEQIVVIEGELNLLSVLDGEMALNTLIDGEMDKVFYVDTQRQVYPGPYVVTPLVNNDVLLETEGLYMEDDVTVLKVPYLETSNPAGGNTAYIGEYVNG